MTVNVLSVCVSVGSLVLTEARGMYSFSFGRHYPPASYVDCEADASYLTQTHLPPDSTLVPIPLKLSVLTMAFALVGGTTL